MSSDPKPASLRDTYATPSSAWNFGSSSGLGIPPAAGSSSSGALTKPSAALSGAMNNSSGIANVKALKWGNPNGGSGDSGMAFTGSAKTSTNTPSPSSFSGSAYAAGSYPYD